MRGRLSIPEIVIGVCAVVVLAAGFLPWAQALFISIRTIDAPDGKIVVGCAVLGIALTLARLLTGAGRTLGLAVNLLLGLVVVAVAAVDMSEFAGGGLWVSLIAGVVWAAAAGYGFLEKRQPTRD